jgi:hypothetical protein
VQARCAQPAVLGGSADEARSAGGLYPTRSIALSSKEGRTFFIGAWYSAGGESAKHVSCAFGRIQRSRYGDRPDPAFEPGPPTALENLHSVLKVEKLGKLILSDK